MSNVKFVALFVAIAMIAIPFFVMAENDEGVGDTGDTITIEELTKYIGYWLIAVKTENVDADGKIIYEVVNNRDFETKRQCLVIAGNDIDVSIPGDLIVPAESGLYCAYATIADSTDLTVEGYFEASDKVYFESTSIDISGGYFSPSVLYPLKTDYSIDMKVTKMGLVGAMLVPSFLEAQPSARALAGLTTALNDAKGFNVKIGPGYSTFEGTIVGTSNGNSTLGVTTKDVVTFRNVDFQNMYVVFSSDIVSLIVNNDSKTLNTLGKNVIFFADPTEEYSTDYMLEKKIRSGNGELSVIVQCGYVSLDESPTPAKAISSNNVVFANSAINGNSNTDVIPGNIYAAYFDEKGLIERYAYLKLNGSEGIEKITSGSEFGETNLFVVANKEYDLTKIKVECRSGYSFDGWYYINENGQETKILDPSHFITMDNMEIYAKATVNQPDYQDALTSIIIMFVILAILAVVGLVYVILRDRRAIKNQ